jgi:recombination protein RecA
MSKLDLALKVLQKKFGKSYIGIGSEILDTDYKRYSLGIFSLDQALGGGIPERKVMMLAGKESSGKTTTALKAIASVQKQGGVAALIDVEHGTDFIWMKKLGVDIEKLIIAQPKSIEEVSDTIETLIMSSEVNLIVLDSVAAPPSDKELDESSEQKSMGGNAKAIGLMMRKITARLNDVKNPVKTALILLNQIRQNIGGWGAAEYCPGGKQLHFHSDIIVWLRPDSKPVNGKDNPKGITVKLKCTKNRTASPFKTGTYDLMFTGEIDEKNSMVGLAVAKGIISKVGYKYTLREKSVTDLKPFIASLIEDDWNYIKEQLILKADVQGEEQEEDDGNPLNLTVEE